MSLIELIGPLDADHPQPLYQQLQKALRDAIENRVFNQSDALPAERYIATELSISRITVRKALDGLVGEGLLTRRQGSGTFVASRVEKSFSKLSSFTEDMLARGAHPHSEWLNRSEGKVTPEESMMLGLSPGEEVYRFVRVRYADDQPMALEYSTISARYLASPEAVGDSLYQALRDAGNQPTRALQRLRAVLFTAEQAAILGVSALDAGLFIERRGFLATGQAVEFTKSYYRGDTYDFVAELSAG
jgi:GntR family transcriptional regulator